MAPDVAGYLALHLQAHLPFVRHPEHEDFLEEDWLYEAITETYLPLLRVFDRLADENVPFRISMTLSPPLVSMLRDELLVHRSARRLERLCELAKLFDLRKAVVRGVPRSEYPLIANLDLLPSVVEMIKIEDQIHQVKSTSAFTALYQALTPCLDHYDYIFLDCATNLYSVSKNALLAADYCVVPYIPDYLSLSGFEILVDMVHDFYNRMGGYFTSRKRPQIAAFIINHFARQRNVFETGVNEFEIMINQLRANGKIHSKAQCLHPYIRFNVHVAESTNEHLPVILHKDSIGAMDYADLTQNFIHHFEVTL